jgi:CRISPR type III-associated protein (TIGR04423 family)
MKIEKSKYQGYLWYSDNKEPQVLNNEVFELEIADNANPFVIEGQLFDGQKSISIKYVDGKYIVNTYDLNTLDGVMQEQTFHSHRMEGKLLKFIQIWKNQSDELCEGMQVLQPAELVFVGFNDKED